MSNIRLSGKLFFKSIFLPIITFSGIGALFALLIKKFIYETAYRYDSGYLSQLTQVAASQKYAFYFFILFLFISYEFVSKARLADAEETILAVEHKRVNFYRGQILFLFIIDFIVSLFVMGLTVFALKYFFIATRDTVVYTVLLIFLTYFLNCGAAICFGAAIALRLKRVAGYAVLLIVAVLASPIAQVTASTFSAFGINIYYILNFFEFFLPNYSFTPNFVFWEPILPYRWALALLWIAASLLLSGEKLFYLPERRAGKKIFTVAMAAIVAVTALTVAIPTSSVEKNEDTTQGDFHDCYYYIMKEKPQKEKKADFSALKYDISMKIRNRLHMDVKVTVDKNNLESYDFTLYHGYKLRKVTDDKGEKLRYDRKNDSITVYSSGDTEYIEFVYSGYSPVFYSNMQGVSLPGDFAYYPIPGWHFVYDVENQNLNSVMLENDVDFSVRVDAPYSDIFCNLDSCGKNEYRGRSNALTFVRGFVKQYDMGSVSVVQSYLNGCKTEYYLSKTIAEMKDAEKELNSSYTMDGKKILLVSAENQNNSGALASDHIIMRKQIDSSSYMTELENLAGREE